MFTELDAVGKTELWRTQATNVEVKLTYGSPAVNIPGVTYEFLDANGVVIPQDAAGTWGPVLTTLAKVQALRKIRFTYNETAALPGNYTGLLKFTDRRAYVNAADVFTVSLPFTIVNPTMDLSTAAQHKISVFNGQALTVYGTSAGPVAQDVYPTYYDLYKAYVNLGSVAGTVGSVIGYNYWGFVSTDAVTAAHPLPLSSPSFIASNMERFAVNNLTIYDTYNVDLYYYYFGNTANKQKLETITVTSKSEIKEGNMVALTPAAPAPAILQVTNGDLATIRHFAPYYRMNDYLGNNLNLFGARDGRAATVTATVDPAYAHLISIAPNVNDWDIKATNAVAALPTAYVDVPVTIAITDLYSVVTSYSVTVRVVRP